MNFNTVGLSFIEGMGLILSPCILPILPLILVTGIDGGRLRPYGIIVGFIATFTGFTLFARSLLGTLHIDPVILQQASIYLILAFGIILFSDTLSEKFTQATQRFANLGQDFSHKAESLVPSGFWSGVFIGAGIALVWTPCAGPILAAVLVQTLQQEANVKAVITLSAFSLGVSVPMLVITLFSKQIIGQIRGLSKHAHTVRKVLAAIIIVTMLFTKFNVWQKIFILSGPPLAEEQFMPATKLIDGLSHPISAPKIDGIQRWINSDPLVLKDLSKQGKVVLIDFWTYSCINCVRTLPYIKSWHQKYHDKGLVIIGIHSPEFEFEKDVTNVISAVKDDGVLYPVAMDNDLVTWSNFDNHYWPAHYLIDKQGKIVYVHFGEGKYDVTENNIRYLLGLGTTQDMMGPQPEAPSPISREQSPETYLGKMRSRNFASPETFKVGEVQTFTYPAKLDQDSWALQGNWIIESERIIAQDKGASIKYQFSASRVYLVMSSDKPDKTVKAKILLNGKPVAEQGGKDVKDSMVTVQASTLYELVHLKGLGNGIIEIQAEDPGLSAYAFTFGSN